MTSTSFEPSWSWPENLPGRFAEDEKRPAPTTTDGPEVDVGEGTEDLPAGGHPPPEPSTPGSAPEPGRRKHYGPRTCRICLEQVLPTFEVPSDNLPDFLKGTPTVEYVSEDGGRLIRPCLCKGSQKYVHEGCLALWRLQDPNNKRNYWQCPTCKYSYRLERMTWAHWIGSTSAQVALTFFIFLVATFALGYVADPIINTYLDPYTTLNPFDEAEPIYDESSGTWLEHFAKGFASLGLLGFFKFILTLSPWHWFNMRNTTMMGGARAGNTGRDRLSQISWIAVIVGISTVLWAVWKGVRAWSRKTLTRASERVMDVPIVDDDDDE